MLSTSSLVIVIALGLIVFYWQFRMHSKELAITHAKRICKNYQLQLLDQSISFTKISVEKRFGKWCLVKIFEFDYADNLQHRKTATLVFHKNTLLSIYMDKQNIIQSTSSPQVEKKQEDSEKNAENNNSNVIQFPRK